MALLMRVPLLLAKWLGLLLVGLVILLIALIAERLSWLPHSLAPLSGEMSARGVSGPITIVRDRNDVPHISGATEEDVYFGLGFAHAQDRLWQMAFTRRLLQGRLSELVGASALKPDQLARALDLEGRARASLGSLSPHARRVLEAYAAGVNAWVEARRTNLPPEFHLLYTGFEPWRAEHSLLILKFLGIGLSGNPVQEIQHARLIKLLGTERAAELFPPYPNSEPIALRDALALEHAQSLDPFLARIARIEGASNNWVVAGRFTKSGKPLLANDPHLGLSAPGVWYLAHLAFPAGNVVGGTIAGIPSVILGHNDHIAWGFTTTHADTEDLVFETLDPTDDTRYLTPHGSEPFVSHTDTIKVRFGAPLHIKVRESRHGPILPPVFKSIDQIAPKGTVAALASTALSRDDTSFDAGLAMIGATDIGALMPGLALYQAPMQNMVFADTEGHIGFAAPARVPMRSATAIANGLTPADGKLQDPLWTGFVPVAELPQTLDPPSGKIWTANNKIVPDDYPHLIAGEWPSPYRAHRIGELLSRGAPYDADDFVRMQMDNRAPEAALLLPRLLGAPQGGAREAQAVKRLGAWDHDMRAEAPEPLIFTAWIVHLQALLIADDLGIMAREMRAPNEAFLANALAPGKDANWCDDTRTKLAETCDAMIARALGAALDEITRSQGRDIAKWRWDRAHIARHSHGVFGSIPLLSKFFNREVPVAGGANTLNRGDMAYGGAKPYVAVHGSGLRAVYALSDLSRSRFMIALGQSGNPLSPYYDHFLRASAQGETIEIATDPAVYSRGALGTWTIIAVPPTSPK
jgi:penicillin amidase